MSKRIERVTELPVNFNRCTMLAVHTVGNVTCGSNAFAINKGECNSEIIICEYNDGECDYQEKMQITEAP